MGFYTKLFAAATGSTEAQVISAKNEIKLLFDKIMNPNIVRQLHEVYEKGYEMAIPGMVRKLGNLLHHHANFSEKEVHAIVENDFFKQFIDIYGYNVYRNSFCVGYLVEIHDFDKKVQDEWMIFLKDLQEKVRHGVIKDVRNDDRVVQCFYTALQNAGDAGMRDGAMFLKRGVLLFD